MINIPEYHQEKICVIGGGWYGCHVTAYLLKHGYKVELLEKNHVLFGESSSKNQCRLHRGLHYVRSWSTRKECMEGYHQLIKLYPTTVKPVDKNYYVVSKKSPIDFRTILDILTASHIPHEVVEPEMNMEGWQGVIQCDEQVFDHLAAADHFFHMLSDHIQFGVHVQDLQQVGDRVRVQTNQGTKLYDYVIDCTYNQLERAQISTPCYYEPCLTFLFKLIQSNVDILERKRPTLV
jgi:glycine/D-amino acid oxidase-like deaminating enzyme